MSHSSHSGAIRNGTVSRVLQTSHDLDPLLDRIGNARIVLLGEASHGTHEYYTWRTAITKRLITEKKFNIIAVEGDWPDCYAINRFIKGYADAGRKAVKMLSTFKRWPTWMWANWEIVALTEWLHADNANKPMSGRTGFYGLDVYSLWESIQAVHQYITKFDPQTDRFVRSVIKCFEPYRNEGQHYARALSFLPEGCTDEVTRLLTEIRRRAPSYDHDPEASLNTEMNAQVIADAEAYYRSMVSFNDKSWNIRDEHMVSTLRAIMNFHGEGAKVIVWEHNTHIGDARYTDMKEEGLWNTGQLIREQNKKDDVFVTGFAGYEGTVIAATSWGGAMRSMPVPPAHEDSYEHMLHEESDEDRLLLFDANANDRFSQWKGQRAIGVVYHPGYERGNYVPTLLSRRYDALIYLDQTSAVHPLHIKPRGHLMPQTYPFNF
jgi:erythromycin esterase